VQLVRADADFRAESVLEAVGETGGRVHHHRARVHLAKKTPGPRVVFGDDGFGVL
jgi:hypothetical protein